MVQDSRFLSLNYPENWISKNLVSFLTPGKDVKTKLLVMEGRDEKMKLHVNLFLYIIGNHVAVKFYY